MVPIRLLLLCLRKYNKLSTGEKIDLGVRLMVTIKLFKKLSIFKVRSMIDFILYLHYIDEGISIIHTIYIYIQEINFIKCYSNAHYINNIY